MLVAVGGRQEGISVSVAVPFPVLVLVPVPITVTVTVPFSVPFSVSVPFPLPIPISISVLALGFGSVWLVARAIVDNIDIAIFRGRHDEPCQGVTPALKTGNCGFGCGCDYRTQLQPESWVAAQAGREMLARRWSGGGVVTPVVRYAAVRYVVKCCCAMGTNQGPVRVLRNLYRLVTDYGVQITDLYLYHLWSFKTPRRYSPMRKSWLVYYVWATAE